MLSANLTHNLQCEQCKQEFKSWRTTTRFCSDECKNMFIKSLTLSLDKFWKRTNDDLIARGLQSLEENGLVYEEWLWHLYKQERSLRNTLELIPDEYKPYINLKRMHTIVRLWSIAPREIYPKKKDTVTRWSMSNIGSIPKEKEKYRI